MFGILRFILIKNLCEGSTKINGLSKHKERCLVKTSDSHPNGLTSKGL